MNGYNVYYPMGYDDDGLPTERLVEKTRGITASEVGRSAFIEECLAASVEAEKAYQALWQRLGLSIDWRYTYRTIDELSRRTSQLSFLDLYRKRLVYRREAPTIWCPECQTAIAQAELNDLERLSDFYTLAFRRASRSSSTPMTRFQPLIGQQVRVPLVECEVPILADPAAEPDKGTGAVMCCNLWRRDRHRLVG